MSGTTLTDSTTSVDLTSYGTGNPFSVGAAVTIAVDAGGGTGIYGDNSLAWTLTNDGTVAGGAGYGMTGIFGNAGAAGVALRSASSTLENSSWIAGGAGTKTLYDGGGGAGVEIDGGEGVFSNTGTIAGGSGGALIYGYYYVSTGAKGGAGLAMSGNGNTITNASGALIEGGYTNGGYYAGSAGISLSANGNLVTNNGTIKAGASTRAAGGTGIVLGGSSNMIANHGLVAGSDGGVEGSVTRHPGQTGFAGGLGIDAEGSLTLANFGTVRGGAGADSDVDGPSGGTAVRMAGGGTIINAADGVISGGTGGRAMTSYFGISGVAGVGGYGVDAAGSLSITNAGTIVGGAGGSGALGSDGARGGSGIALAGSLALSNSGTLLGGAGGEGSTGSNYDGSDYRQVSGAGGEAVGVGGGAHLVNSGTIAGGPGAYGRTLGGAGGAGISLTGVGTITNRAGALISGGGGGNDAPPHTLPGSNRYFTGNGGTALSLASGTVTNAGTITGGAAGAGNKKSVLGVGGVGVVFTGSADSTLINSGTISGGSGAKAVQFGAGNDRLILRPFGALIGGADGGSGTNSLELGTGKVAGAIAGLGSAISNFQAVMVDVGAVWKATGATQTAAGSTLAIAGTLTLAGATQLAGTVSGAGRLIVRDATTTLADGTALTVKSLTLVDGGKLIVDGTLSYVGAFTENVGTALAVASGKTLTLTHGAHFAGTVAGAGRLALAGGTSTFAGGAKFTIGTLALSGTASALVNTTLSVAGKVAMAAGTKIAVAAGRTLTLANLATGSGTIAIGANATLAAERYVVANETVAFTAKTGRLQISTPAAFNAGISKFAAGDRIDIASSSFAFNKAETVTFTENAGKTAGTLTVKNGAHALSLHLFGQYVAQGFHLASDGHGGTAITYQSPAAQTLVQLTAGGHG